MKYSPSDLISLVRAGQIAKPDVNGTGKDNLPIVGGKGSECLSPAVLSVVEYCTGLPTRVPIS